MEASMKLATIGSDNGLSSIRRQTITWTNGNLLSGGLKLQWNLIQNTKKFSRKRILICRLQNSHSVPAPAFHYVIPWGGDPSAVLQMWVTSGLLYDNLSSLFKTRDS